MPIHFKFSAPNRITHFAEIEMRITEIDAEEIILELPSWRPGRYELGNFARNIRKWQPFNDKNEPLVFKKISKDSWKVSTEGSKIIIIRYEYFCTQADAGGCWIDEHQIYINPVHCFLYIRDRLHEPCTVDLNIPTNYKIVCGLNKSGERTLHASDFHELFDSPFIASDSLQMNQYQAGGKDFYIWFQGRCNPDWPRILNDFRKFTEAQLEMMGDFPFSEYSFLVQVLPYKFYHGVEHLTSTVLALGPGKELMSGSLYIDFIGVASHELFHAWNVKAIRPDEMLPYNYKTENYSRLGFVYEGVTTYFGDLFLARCGVYSVQQFFDEINVRLQKHFDNPGRFNLSVADSSYDTWLDGYNPGIPGRKTSIYDEGCLVAMMTDLIIRKNTNSKFSLDDVMKTLYTDFGKKNIGYTEHDYISIIENIAGVPMADFFLDHIYGTEDDEKVLSELLTLAGCELVRRSSSEQCERYFGFKVSVSDKITRVTHVFPSSPAFIAGLGKDDEIVAVNEIKVEENMDALMKMFSGQKLVLTIISPMKMLKDIPLTPSKSEFYYKYSIAISKNANKEHREFFRSWLKQEFEKEYKVERTE
jgi:predicted metalloprotease with PDZ domain